MFNISPDRFVRRRSTHPRSYAPSSLFSLASDVLMALCGILCELRILNEARAGRRRLEGNMKQYSRLPADASILSQPEEEEVWAALENRVSSTGSHHRFV